MGSYEVRGVKPRRFPRGPVFMLLICSAFTEVSADFTDLFDYIPNHGLPGHDDELITSITPEECAQKCLEGTTIVPEGECLSFDYVKSISRCQLSRTAGQPLVSHDDYDHYEMKDILRFFTAYPDQALPRHDDVIVRPATVSPRTCTLRCLLGEGSLSVGSCLSFDLDSNPERCLLSRDNQDTAGETFGFNARFDHYQRNEFCVPNPCIHGNCTSEANGYTCTCDVGWEGDACDTFTACSPGEFGPGCNGTCHCLTGDSACNIQTGACTGGCAAGWKGNDCQTVCSPGDFGPGCTGTCNCLNGDSACNIQTGACIGGCAAGWKGNDCQTACTPGEFGPGCNGTCNCLTGDSACNIQTGVCTGGCAAGWKGNDCQTVCSPGEFGSNCVSTCHCADGDSVCLADTGNCSRGGCADGWEGDSCQIDVNECDTDVDNCHIYATCLNSAGSFNCSCNLGYQGNGTSCTEQKAVGLPLVGIIVGVVAGVIVIGAVVAVVFYRRRKNKDAPKQRNVPLKNIGNQPKQGGARNDAFNSENGRDTSTSERLSDLTTVADVQRFLIANGLQECARAFRENDVDGTALRHLDDAMMKDLVPMVGPRARLKAVLQGLKGSGTLIIHLHHYIFYLT
ncbi:fibrillin-3-like [Branchiostoma floridae]|uniref:Fibrillin-3-like n=1 Tax=Branchiostoma floridae TaxID=7739 RepID=A0A9J7MGN8_BRAFL|nr:fibrillin-3-like [Branchiostoma floridae]